MLYNFTRNFVNFFLITHILILEINVPTGKEVIYNYYADVKAGTIEPAQYASQFGLAGELRMRELSGGEVDPNGESHYYVKLNKMKYGLYNGKVSYSQSIQVDQNIEEEAQQIENPFVIVYHNGKVNCLCFSA